MKLYLMDTKEKLSKGKRPRETVRVDAILRLHLLLSRPPLQHGLLSEQTIRSLES